MSGFGDWYKEQQSQTENGGNSSSSHGGLLDGILSLEETLPMFITETTDSFNANLSSLTTSFEAQLPKKVMGMNYHQRFKIFCGALFVSGLFFSLAFFVGLPMVTVRPQKFALSFTSGSIAFMLSFSILKGPWEHLQSLCVWERLPFTISYFSSMFATMYFTFNARGVSGYVLVLSASVVQLIALVWYLIAFIPGGASGLKLVAAGMAKMIQPILMMVATCCKGLMRLCISCCAK